MKKTTKITHKTAKHFKKSKGKVNLEPPVSSAPCCYSSCKTCKHLTSSSPSLSSIYPTLSLMSLFPRHCVHTPGSHFPPYPPLYINLSLSLSAVLPPSNSLSSCILPFQPCPLLRLPLSLPFSLSVSLSVFAALVLFVSSSSTVGKQLIMGGRRGVGG